MRRVCKFLIIYLFIFLRNSFLFFKLCSIIVFKEYLAKSWEIIKPKCAMCFCSHVVSTVIQNVLCRKIRSAFYHYFLFDGTQRQHFSKIYYLGLHKCVLEILSSKQRPRRCDTSKLTQSLKMMHNFYSCLEICVWPINNENNCGSI